MTLLEGISKHQIRKQNSEVRLLAFKSTTRPFSGRTGTDCDTPRLLVETITINHEKALAGKSLDPLFGHHGVFHPCGSEYFAQTNAGFGV